MISFWHTLTNLHVLEQKREEFKKTGYPTLHKIDSPKNNLEMKTFDDSPVHRLQTRKEQFDDLEEEEADDIKLLEGVSVSTTFPSHNENNKSTFQQPEDSLKLQKMNTLRFIITTVSYSSTLLVSHSSSFLDYFLSHHLYHCHVINKFRSC